jgi:hypothetical protein
MKLKINIDELAEGFFEGTRLFGIVAPMKDYQFCWHLNSMLGLDFRVNHEVEIQLTKKKRKYFFSVYEYKEPLTSQCHYLYNNQHDGEYLLSQFKHMDFLWLIRGDEIESQVLEELHKSIRTIPGVQLVKEIESDGLKQRAHLIF